ncbi:hypothetical protein D9M68_897010 [compost metagenome]
MVGSTNSVNSVPISVGITTTMPIENRLAEPAPSANTSGTRPATIAAVVISTGRMRTAAAFSMASRRLRFSCCWMWLAKVTIRMPCLLIRPISVTNPICV